MVTKKPGSALLIVMLILASSGIILLTVSQVLLSSRRVVADTEAGMQAEQLAQAGIDEGLLRLSKNSLLSGEYGSDATKNDQILKGSVATISYTLVSMRRTVAAVGNCSGVSADMPSDSALPQECPYYSLSVRHLVNLFPNKASYRIDRSLLPIGKTVTFTIYYSETGVNLVAQGQASYHYCENSKPCVDGTNYPAGRPFQILNTVRVGKSATVGVTLTAPSDLVVSGSGGCVGSQFLMDKGATTIDSEGYVGNSRRGLLLTIPSYDPTGNTRIISPFSELFDQYGTLPSLLSPTSNQGC